MGSPVHVPNLPMTDDALTAGPGARQQDRLRGRHRGQARKAEAVPSTHALHGEEGAACATRALRDCGGGCSCPCQGQEGRRRAGSRGTRRLLSARPVVRGSALSAHASRSGTTVPRSPRRCSARASGVAITQTHESWLHERNRTTSVAYEKRRRTTC